MRYPILVEFEGEDGRDHGGLRQDLMSTIVHHFDKYSLPGAVESNGLDQETIDDIHMAAGLFFGI